MKTYYDICPKCGCTLDPGETCEDCYPRQTICQSGLDYKTVIERLMRKEKELNHENNAERIGCKTTKL